jgi:hypothetical protein
MCWPEIQVLELLIVIGITHDFIMVGTEIIFILLIHIEVFILTILIFFFLRYISVESVPDNIWENLLRISLLVFRIRCIELGDQWQNLLVLHSWDRLTILMKRVCYHTIGGWYVAKDLVLCPHILRVIVYTGFVSTFLLGKVKLLGLGRDQR